MLQKLAQMLDLGELVRRAVKYLVEGLMVALAAYAIPKKSLNLDEVALIALTAAATFSILIHTFHPWQFQLVQEQDLVLVQTSLAFPDVSLISNKNKFKLK